MNRHSDNVQVTQSDDGSYSESSDSSVSSHTSFSDNDNVSYDSDKAVKLLKSKFQHETKKKPKTIHFSSDDDNSSTTTEEDNGKTNHNKSMSSQQILLLSQKFSHVITLIESFHKSNKTAGKRTNRKKKSSKKARLSQVKDLTLALRTLKKMNLQFDKASSDHCNTYAKACNKRKRVEQEDAYILTHGLDSKVIQLDKDLQDLHHKRQMCREFVDDVKKKRDVLSPTRMSKRRKKIPSNTVELKRHEKVIFLPKPKIGGCYFPKEMAEILTNVIDPSDMFFIVRKMISFKFVPCNERMVLRHVANYKKGKELPLRFRKPGRKRFITPEEIKKIRKRIIRNGGEGVGINQTRKVVQEYADKWSVANGRLPSYDGGKPVSNKTVRIYHEDFALHKHIGIRRSLCSKTIPRIAAENSLRSVTSFLLTVAATHFIIGDAPKGHPCLSRKGTTGAQKFVKIMRKVLGLNTPFYPVHRSLMSSTDDTTIFVCPKESIPKKQNDVILVSEKHDDSTQMCYQPQPKNSEESSRGMRVKMTFTFLGNGIVSPVYVTVSGFTERDIPKSSCPSGIKVIPIPGLCLERNRDPKCKKVGYLVLLRNDVTLESVHLRNHEHYHKEVYRPFIQKSRSDFHDFDLNESDEIPDDLTCVGWMDGDIQHLKAIVKEEIRDQCVKDKNVKCKQSAKRTGVEQVCDVSIVFKELKRIEKFLILAHIMNDSLSAELNEIFKSLYDSDEINLTHAKTRILKDFLARLPYLLEKSCTTDNVVKGFVDVGLLDEKDKVWPDFDKILKTKRKNITEKERKLIMSNFKRLYDLTIKEGHVPDSVYDELGFPPDTVGNVIYPRDHSISSEWRQRAKEITHEFQRDLRLARMAKIQEKFLNRIQKDRDIIEGLLKANSSAEEKLMVEIKENNRLSDEDSENYSYIDESVDHATLLMFWNLSNPELKAFIHVRLSQVKTISKTVLKKFPIKGSFEESLKVMRDDLPDDTLATLAFKQRHKPVILN